MVMENYSAGQKFRTFNAMDFLWPPGRLEKKSFLNVRNF